MFSSIAKKLSVKTGLEREDLFSEACLIAVEQIPKYNSNRGCVTTFLHMTIKKRLRNYISEQIKQRQRPLPLPIDNKLPDRSEMFIASIKEMSQPAKEICTMIMNRPEKYIEMDMQDLTKYLLSIGWKWTTIRSAFKDIKQLLRT